MSNASPFYVLPVTGNAIRRDEIVAVIAADRTESSGRPIGPRVIVRYGPARDRPRSHSMSSHDTDWILHCELVWCDTYEFAVELRDRILADLAKDHAC